MNTAALRLICAAAYLVYAASVSGNNLSPGQPGFRESVLANSAELGQIITHQGTLIMELDDVVGIGEGMCDSKPCIRVFLARDNTASIARIEEILAGIPFAIDISGDFSASPQ